MIAIDELHALIEKVRRGDDTALAAQFHAVQGGKEWDQPSKEAFDVESAFNKDMNAALRLFFSLLPDWEIQNLGQQSDKRWWCSLHRPVEGDEDGNITRHSTGASAFDVNDTAQALLLATLRGYETEHREE